MVSRMILPIKLPEEFSKIEPLTADEQLSLAKKIGVDHLPFWGTVTGFSGTDFFDDVDFSGFIFIDNFVFADSHFYGNAIFEDCLFMRQANFSGCTFEEDVSFDRVLFRGLFVLSGVRATSLVSFRNANFAGSLFGTSDSPTFLSNVDFTGARFTARADFQDIAFQGIANFNNAIFEDRTSFEGTSFVAVPTFHSAQIHQDTTFHRVKFPSKSPTRRRADAEERAWRTLKLAMNKVNSQETELRFFCREMSARIPRLRDEGHHARALCLVLYRLTSTYGTSFLRPFLLFFLTIFLFSGLYSLELAKTFGIATSGKVLSECFGIAAATALNPTNIKSSVDLLSGISSQAGSAEFWLIPLSLQVLVSTVLLFLMALSIKNHFSMK